MIVMNNLVVIKILLLSVFIMTMIFLHLKIIIPKNTLLLDGIKIPNHILANEIYMEQSKIN